MGKVDTHAEAIGDILMELKSAEKKHESEWSTEGDSDT